MTQRPARLRAARIPGYHAGGHCDHKLCGEDPDCALRGEEAIVIVPSKLHVTRFRNTEFDMLRRSVAIAAVLSLFASVASAATLTNVTGNVAVNQGAGFRPATGGMQLNPGDRVTVRSGGSARIVLGPNSVVTVEGGQTFTVPDDRRAGGLLPAGEVAPAAGLSPQAIGAGVAVAAAAGIGIAVAASNDDSSSPFPIPVPPISP